MIRSNNYLTPDSIKFFQKKLSRSKQLSLNICQIGFQVDFDSNSDSDTTPHNHQKHSNITADWQQKLTTSELSQQRASARAQQSTGNCFALFGPLRLFEYTSKDSQIRTRKITIFRNIITQ